MLASYPERRFQLWEYRVSHGSLLVRSPRGPKAALNVDIVFVGVEYVAAPRLMHGIHLLPGEPDDVARVTRETERELGAVDRVFVLSSAGHRHLVVAAGYRVEEHQRDIFDSPFDSSAT